MVARIKANTVVLVTLLATPILSYAQTDGACGVAGVEARGGVAIPDEGLESGSSVGVGFSCDVGARFGVGADVEREGLGDADMLRVLGTGRMVLIGEQGGGALVLRGAAGLTRSSTPGGRIEAPLRPDFEGTRRAWDATGLTMGGGMRARADLNHGWLGFVEGGVRAALLHIQEHWEAGELVETEGVFVTSIPFTAGLGVRF